MTLVNQLPQRHRIPATVTESRALARISYPTALSRSELLLVLHSALKRFAPDRLRMLQVTSATHGEGVTTISRDLAQVVAYEVGYPVLLISASPSQDGPDGLEAVVDGSQSLDDAMEADPKVPYLYRAKLSTGGNHAGLLFESDGLQQVLRKSLRIAKLIIVDAPPVLSDVTAVALAAQSAGVLLVIEADKTRASVVERARRNLEAAGAQMCGVVLNKRKV